MSDRAMFLEKNSLAVARGIEVEQFHILAKLRGLVGREVARGRHMPVDHLLYIYGVEVEIEVMHKFR